MEGQELGVIPDAVIQDLADMPLVVWPWSDEKAIQCSVEGWCQSDSIARIVVAAFGEWDDAPVALEEDSQPQKAGADGSPLTLDVWVEQLAVEAPHLFEQNAGGGAVGNGSGGSGN